MPALRESVSEANCPGWLKRLSRDCGYGLWIALDDNGQVIVNTIKVEIQATADRLLSLAA
jgi:hypothetical protein